MLMRERLQQIVEESIPRNMAHLYKTTPGPKYTVYRVYLAGIMPLNIILPNTRKRASSQAEAQRDWTEHKRELLDNYLGLIRDQKIRYRFAVRQNEYAHRNLFTGKIEVIHETEGSTETFTVPEKWFDKCEDYVKLDDEAAKARFRQRMKANMNSSKPQI